MSTQTWEMFHRRSQLVHTVIERAERAGDGRLPWDEVPGAAAVFGTPDQLLLALSQWWETTLGSHIDQALERDSHHMSSSVAAAWMELAQEYPGLRRVLDHAATNPALAAAVRHEYRLLAVAAGLATMNDPHDRAAQAGIGLIDHWRARQNQARDAHIRQEDVAVPPKRYRPRRRRIIASPA